MPEFLSELIKKTDERKNACEFEKSKKYKALSMIKAAKDLPAVANGQRAIELSPPKHENVRDNVNVSKQKKSMRKKISNLFGH